MAGSATGAWAGPEGKIAAWQDGAWAFYAPRRLAGWASDEDTLYIYSGSAWTASLRAWAICRGHHSSSAALSTRNGFNIGFEDATGITDDAGNEQLVFRKTASAVNQVGSPTRLRQRTPPRRRGQRHQHQFAAARQGHWLYRVDKVGINASADATNRLSMNSPASCSITRQWSPGQGEQNAAGDTATFSTRPTSPPRRDGHHGRRRLSLQGERRRLRLARCHSDREEHRRSALPSMAENIVLGPYYRSHHDHGRAIGTTPAAARLIPLEVVLLCTAASSPTGIGSPHWG